ncbi:MAG TPA: methyltransferase [Chitinophagaceae bacterium]|nr:methyltransferase [Chitinophagaceae bacterium]
MANSYFQFRQFTIHQDQCAMKVTTDGCLFGAWVAAIINTEKLITNNCLDIGTGTGLLALMSAQKNNIEIDAIETDKDAAEQAAANIDDSPWEDRIKIINADVRKFFFRHQYDVIISNPPFYDNELKAADKRKNIALHGDDLSLAELPGVIKTNLSPHGMFYLLLPYKRNDEIKKLLLKNDMVISKLVLVRQSVNHDYFRIMLQGKLKTDKVVETSLNEITIADEKQQYSSAFRDLLKDYYLHL